MSASASAPRAPDALCLSCRALLDAGQRCACRERARVALDDGAAARVEAALLEVPDVSLSDSLDRFVMSTLLGPGSVAAAFSASVFALSVLLVDVSSLAVAAAAAWTLLSLGWVALFGWSELDLRRPRYPGVAPAPLPDEPVLEGILEAGTIEFAELSQDGPRPRVLHDARAAEALIVRLPGERVEVPAGRLEVRLPAHRRLASTPRSLAEGWGALPPALRRAGRLRAGRLGPGCRVALHDGAVEPLPERGASFREAADRRSRFVARTGRPVFQVL